LGGKIIMKKYIIIISLILGANCWAQTGNKGNFPKEEFLSQFGSYFENAEITENGVLRLKAKENQSIIKDTYSSLEPGKKISIMESVMSKANCSLAIIEYKDKRELWSKNPNSKTVTLSDSWDLNTLYLPESTSKKLKKNDAHPFFQYYGLSGSFSEEQMNFYYTSHLGFFLFKDRWDFALTYGLGIFGNGESSNYHYQVGLMSKVYFPIRKINLAPYAGLGVSFGTMYDEDWKIVNSSWNIPIYLGINWYIGPGGLDLGAQITNNNGNTNVTFMIGYTFSPSKLSQNKSKGNSYSKPAKSFSSVPAYKNETTNNYTSNTIVQTAETPIYKNESTNNLVSDTTVEMENIFSYKNKNKDEVIREDNVLPKESKSPPEKPAMAQSQETIDKNSDNSGGYNKDIAYTGYQKFTFTETTMLVSISGEQFQAAEGDIFDGEMKSGKIVQGKVIRGGKTIKMFWDKRNN